MRLQPSYVSAICLAAAVLGHGRTSFATSGAHAPAISTFDTRASSIVFAARSGFADTTWRAFSYNANFTSTSGNFSAQFGAHYLQIRENAGDTLMHGAAASGAGVFNIPLTSRFDNGVPLVSFNLYGGAVPTAAVSGARNFISLPITVGVGTTLSPLSWLSFTPWFEVAPSGTLDTRLRRPNLDELTGVDSSTIDTTNLTPEQIQQLQGQQLFTEEDVNKVIDDSVDLRFSVHVAMRAGMMITARLGERVSANLDGGIVGFGPAFKGAVTGYLGGGLVIHWDDIVPAVLPAQRRLAGENCEDVERRFRSCPAGIKMYSGQKPGAPKQAPVEPSPAPAPVPAPGAVEEPTGTPPAPPAPEALPPLQAAPPTGTFPPPAPVEPAGGAAEGTLPARTSPYESPAAAPAKP